MSFAEIATIILTLVGILVLFISDYYNRKKKAENATPQTIDDMRLNVVRQTFCGRGRLVEEVMQMCFKHPHTRLFQDYHKMNEREKRNAFCDLCLQASATGNGGIIEVAMLSTEFANMYRADIMFLPEEFQKFYKTTRLISTFHLSDHLFETENMLAWAEIHLSESEVKRKQKMHRLAQAFASGKIMLQFKRRTVVGPLVFAPDKEEQGERASK